MIDLPAPLVTVEWLADHLDAPELRIVDCRFDLGDTEAGRRSYEEGHVPGAVYFSLDDDLSAAQGPGRHPLPSAEAFAATLSRAGIGNEHAVVAYDASGGAYASRLWWMLRSLGHQAVAVLDGGWQAWERVGGRVETAAPSHPPTTYVAPPRWSGTIDGTELERRLGDVVLVDARTGARYRGEVEPLDRVAGHIPTAHNLPWGDNLDSDGRFLGATSLAERYAGTDGAVVYCGSGVTACHDLLAMDVAGVRNGVLYPGSWSDWCTAGGEIALGPEPGTPTR